jgi:hypothetical protein
LPSQLHLRPGDKQASLSRLQAMPACPGLKQSDHIVGGLVA